ncbi:PA2928 family protein [Glycomyces mayteni]|uniref:PA2928 family protein n=1 Tax=Glycomyces mayteni TaxID=543887 RepID=A0ABW2DHP7_9ACTN
MFQDFRAAGPLPPHSQLVRSPYGTPEHPLEPKRRPRGAGGAIFGFALLMTAGTFVAAVGGEYLTAPQPDVMLRTGIAFSADGLALVPYDRAGAGGLLSELATDVNAVRLAAVDLATGETRWDVQLADELDRDAAAVAAGEQYAYIATADGLEIRDLDDGALVTEAGDVPGLEGAGTGTAAYGLDPEAGVVAFGFDGGLRTLALDALEAAPADPATAEAWAGRLAAEGAAPQLGGMTTTEASIGEDATIRVEPTADGAVTSGLAVVEGGDRRALGTRAYTGAAIVLDQTATTTTWDLDVDVDGLIDGLLNDPDAAEELMDDPTGAVDLTVPAGTAAGAASGHALIEHQRAPGGDGYALTVLDLADGGVTASIDTADHVGRSMTAPGGQTIAIVAPADGLYQSDLLIIAADGSVDRAAFGAFDLLGEPDTD